MSVDAANAALTAFLAGKPIDIGKTLAQLPRGASTELAARAVMSLVEQPHSLAAACAVLPATVIRAVLATAHASSAHLFLRLAVPADAKAAALKATWAAAVDALRALDDTLATWESGKRVEMCARLARDPHVLAGVQGVVAHRADVELDHLAILAIDGSDASVDALIPHLDPALGDRTARLERLVQLRACARRTPALDALFAEIDGAVVEYRKASPARALAIAIGDLGRPPPDVLSFQFLLGSTQRSGPGIPRVQGRVRVDSRDVPWFSVWIARVAEGTDRAGDRETRFTEAGVAGADGLEVGACAPAALPTWLATTAKRLAITWQPFLVTASTNPKRITAWLQAAHAPT